MAAGPGFMLYNRCYTPMTGMPPDPGLLRQQSLSKKLSLRLPARRGSRRWSNIFYMAFARYRRYCQAEVAPVSASTEVAFGTGSVCQPSGIEISIIRPSAQHQYPYSHHYHSSFSILRHTHSLVISIFYFILASLALSSAS